MRRTGQKEEKDRCTGSAVMMLNIFVCMCVCVCVACLSLPSLGIPRIHPPHVDCIPSIQGACTYTETFFHGGSIWYLCHMETQTPNLDSSSHAGFLCLCRVHRGPCSSPSFVPFLLASCRIACISTRCSWRSKIALNRGPGIGIKDSKRESG